MGILPVVPRSLKKQGNQTIRPRRDGIDLRFVDPFAEIVIESVANVLLYG
jgi:hypothetical protein